jgi:hypothetical protein
MSSNLTIYPQNTTISSDILNTLKTYNSSSKGCLMTTISKNINVNETVNIDLYYRGVFVNNICFAVVFYGAGTQQQLTPFDPSTFTYIPSSNNINDVNSFNTSFITDISNNLMTQTDDKTVYYLNISIEYLQQTNNNQSFTYTSNPIILYLGKLNFKSNKVGNSLFNVKLISTTSRTSGTVYDINNNIGMCDISNNNVSTIENLINTKVIQSSIIMDYNGSILSQMGLNSLIEGAVLINSVYPSNKLSPTNKNQFILFNNTKSPSDYPSYIINAINNDLDNLILYGNNYKFSGVYPTDQVIINPVTIKSTVVNGDTLYIPIYVSKNYGIVNIELSYTSSDLIFN